MTPKLATDYAFPVAQARSALWHWCGSKSLICDFGAVTNLLSNCAFCLPRSAGCRLGTDVEVKPSGKKGNGLFAMRSIEEGIVIGRYNGELLTDEQYEARLQDLDGPGMVCRSQPPTAPGTSCHA